MASKEKLAQWLFDNRNQLQLKTLLGTWVKDWLPGFNDIRVQLQVDGKPYTGRGIAADQDQAFLIAGAEAIERAYCDNLGIHSNGIALHTNEENAKLNAKMELLERDGFLCHFLTKTPFADLKTPSGINIDFEQIKNRLKNLRVEITLKKVIYSYPQITLCIARKTEGENPFSCILGLGSHEDIKVSTTKAITECLSNVVWRLEDKNVKTINIENFKNKSHHSSMDHQMLYLEDDNDLSLNWIFYSENSSNTVEAESEIELSTLKSNILILDEAPIVVIRAMSNDLQNIFYGPTTLEKINMKRLHQFTGSSVDESNINWMPHPIG
ncbi:MAG: YcaO-like family protein [Pseudobdellovibrionaceae bacterium]|nr:MAG: YcaO-like family protein [Pseudobdellovibrionaceae bacterium]